MTAKVVSGVAAAKVVHGCKAPKPLPPCCHLLLQICNNLGGTWLTSEYAAGDVLIFSVYTVHASLDNTSNTVRLSADSRYQPASQPADERWVGDTPIGHCLAGQRGRHC